MFERHLCISNLSLYLDLAKKLEKQILRNKRHTYMCIRLMSKHTFINHMSCGSEQNRHNNLAASGYMSNENNFWQFFKLQNNSLIVIFRQFLNVYRIRQPSMFIFLNIKVIYIFIWWIIVSVRGCIKWIIKI